MDLKRWIRNFFSFSRSQTNGFLLFLPLILIFIFSAPLYRWWESRQPRDFSVERARLDSLSAFWLKDEVNVVPDEEEVAKTLFAFNPNTATADELQALGFSAGLTKRLVNYRNAGGQFNIKADLLKLYGMDSSFYKSIAPFVLLPDEVRRAEVETTKIVREEKKEVKFDLNRADTTLLKSIYGIGSKLSRRIVTFRESLGGFIYLDQLYEVYGLDSVVVSRLKESSFIQPDFYPRTLNLNEVTEGQLETHPYISKRMAKAIVAYRFQHGKYHAVEDLQKIISVDESILTKLKPYITFE